MLINNNKLLQYLSENNVKTIQIRTNIRKYYNTNKKINTEPVTTNWLVNNINNFVGGIDTKKKGLIFLHNDKGLGKQSFFTTDKKIEQFIINEMKEQIIERL
jgi:hypothetical protein